MVSLLEEKALFSKEQSAAKSKSGGKYRVIYKGHKYISKGKKKAFVRTKVIVPAENVDIDLNYKLRVHDGEWKIYDVIVDEASLVANYKYQFNSIITKHGYDELVSRMTRKLDEIKGNRNKKDDRSGEKSG
jgi:ABC-type transporter MlaC component